MTIQTDNRQKHSKVKHDAILFFQKLDSGVVLRGRCICFRAQHMVSALPAIVFTVYLGIWIFL